VQSICGDGVANSGKLSLECLFERQKMVSLRPQQVLQAAALLAQSARGRLRRAVRL
jgi:hypothetical protein